MTVNSICTTRRAKVVIPILWIISVCICLPFGFIQVIFSCWTPELPQIHIWAPLVFLQSTLKWITMTITVIDLKDCKNTFQSIPWRSLGNIFIQTSYRWNSNPPELVLTPIFLFQEETEEFTGHYKCHYSNSFMTSSWAPVAVAIYFVLLILLPFCLLVHNYVRISVALFQSLKENVHLQERVSIRWVNASYNFKWNSDSCVFPISFRI